MFQSSPDPKTGCNIREWVTGQRCHVSILTRSEDRVQRYEDGIPYIGRNVSILTRSEDRVQLPCTKSETASLRCFNPHPIRRPGATQAKPAAEDEATAVSILTRSEDRVQLTDIRAWLAA